MEFKVDGQTFSVVLVDEGTLDTVLKIEGTDYAVRFDQEYAEAFRNKKTGALTERGFKELAHEVIDDYLTNEALEETLP